MLKQCYFRLSTLFLVGAISTALLAQTSTNDQVELFEFVNSINWSLTEEEFISSSTYRVDSTKHYYNDYSKTTADYKVKGLFLDNYECEAIIFVDSISRILKSLNIRILTLDEKANYLKTSSDMDKILFSILDRPDAIKEEPNNKYVKSMDRTWYKENYTVSVMHMGFDDNQIYSLSIEGVDNTKKDFRVAKWGDSKKTIMEYEGQVDKYDSDKLYVFTSSLAGMSCDVAYIFTDDKLTMAKYIFNEEHTNKNDYISDFRKIVKLMTEKYGEPSWDSPEWRNSLYKDDPEDYGFAVSLGHLIYSAGWFTKKTDISVYLTGENYEISLTIQYVSKKYKQLRENQSKKQDLDNL